ncbi:MAG: hypothetical protein CMJ65_05100 [Planctomycetaceae bacterium]|jgi:transcriptional regulator with XRE-family HTH domain|nr:hypothetical protein [Planctomycetaceae bacterium]MDP7274709.1 helix-turn-helix transcriptional regulator [Planctomycetaceae bacterium]
MALSVSELCEQQQLSVEQLTERSGLDPQRVLSIMLGRWTPSPGERQKIAASLGVDLEEISWGHKTPIQHIYGHGPG